MLGKQLAQFGLAAPNAKGLKRKLNLATISPRGTEVFVPI